MKKINFQSTFSDDRKLRQIKQNSLNTVTYTVFLSHNVWFFNFMRSRSDKDFWLGTGNGRMEMNFVKIKKTSRYYHSLLSLNISGKYIISSMRNSDYKRGGGRKRKVDKGKKTSKSHCKVLQWKRNTLK